MQYGTLIMFIKIMASANMVFLVREACTKNNALYKKDILHEATRIVAKQRTVPQQLSGTTKECTINNEPLDIDDPRVDDLQVTIRTNIIDKPVPNPQPPPLLPGGEVKVNETSVITTDEYFLYRMGATVPKTVTHVQGDPYGHPSHCYKGR